MDEKMNGLIIIKNRAQVSSERMIRFSFKNTMSFSLHMNTRAHETFWSLFLVALCYPIWSLPKPLKFLFRQEIFILAKTRDDHYGKNIIFNNWMECCIKPERARDYIKLFSIFTIEF